jgi:hypothetical protein
MKLLSRVLIVPPYSPLRSSVRRQVQVV